MDTPDPDYLTTRELAELLRIKERKVYDLAASGDVPCVRVVGKLLFPRAEIRAWLDAARSGPASPPGAQTTPQAASLQTPPQPPAADLPAIAAGSHDPLFDWALRESGCGLASFFDGSHDGLDRMARRAAACAGLHVHDPDSPENGGWNVAAVHQALGNAPVVLVAFARRQRGLVLAPQIAGSVTAVGDLACRRFVRRQPAAAAQRLFETLARAEGLDPAALPGPDRVARSEDEIARAIVNGDAEAGFGLAAVAAENGLAFLPVIEERFDLLVWRQAWFEPPFQAFLDFTRSRAFRARAAEMTGYDIAGLGQVVYNARP